MKRDTGGPTPKKGEWSCPDKEFAKKFPNLSQGLCDCFWEDGKARVPWTLTLRFDADGVNGCLNDKEGSRGAYTTGATLADVIALMEAAVSAGTLSWRRWRK
jgi:hypothetical protein